MRSEDCNEKGNSKIPMSCTWLMSLSPVTILGNVIMMRACYVNQVNCKEISLVCRQRGVVDEIGHHLFHAMEVMKL